MVSFCRHFSIPQRLILLTKAMHKVRVVLVQIRRRFRLILLPYSSSSSGNKASNSEMEVVEDHTLDKLRRCRHLPYLNA